MNSKIHDALETILEFVAATRNLDDPMLLEIKNAHQTLTDYINQHDSI